MKQSHSTQVQLLHVSKQWGKSCNVDAECAKLTNCQVICYIVYICYTKFLSSNQESKVTNTKNINIQGPKT